MASANVNSINLFLNYWRFSYFIGCNSRFGLPFLELLKNELWQKKIFQLNHSELKWIVIDSMAEW